MLCAFINKYYNIFYIYLFNILAYVYLRTCFTAVPNIATGAVTLKFINAIDTFRIMLARWPDTVVYNWNKQITSLGLYKYTHLHDPVIYYN